ncbi:coiled-coil domain-containing protein 62 isoform X3 [Echeneis naucrates]|uniref:coiled-coil domain-containing protein 62 isoform X3 n=1 Tax=Echeneis naucrates TaxID=173247 RepID=UPI001113DE92|nr:coiled-coil domain-containing protein 62 isoform X3 [Echeneis naucrates]
MDGRASVETPDEPWSSTPVKKVTASVYFGEKEKARPLDLSHSSVLSSLRMDRTGKRWSERSPPIPADGPSSPQDSQLRVNDLSVSTIQKQRKELQLLMAELKDRDQELNSMAASHHRQIQAWEQDRQKVLCLEQRCSRLEDMLQKRDEMIRALKKRILVVELEEKEVQKVLSAAQHQLHEFEQNQQHVNQRCQDWEEKNQSLTSTLMALSTQVGSLQVREEELSSMLKLKDKDVTEATGRLRDLEASLTESRSRETKLLRDMEENKRRYREAKHAASHLKDGCSRCSDCLCAEELQQQITQSSSQREEIIRLKQELQILHSNLALAEGDSLKDELLELTRSKQERTKSELCCLQQVYEKQRNDLQRLRLNLDSAREMLRDKSNCGLHGRCCPSLCPSQEDLTCHCPDSHSPASTRARKSGPVGDPTSLRGPEYLGVRSPQLTDQTEDLLQQLQSPPRPKGQLWDRAQSTSTTQTAGQTTPDRLHPGSAPISALDGSTLTEQHIHDF